MHIALVFLLIAAFAAINHLRGGGGEFGVVGRLFGKLPGRSLLWASILSGLIAIPLLAGSSATYPIALLGAWITQYLPAPLLYGLMLTPAWLVYSLPGFAFGLSYFLWGVWAWGRWQSLKYGEGGRDKAHPASLFERVIEKIAGPSNYIAYALRNVIGFATSALLLTPFYFLMVPLQTLAYDIGWRLAKGASGVSRGELIFGGCWGGSLALLTWWEDIAAFFKPLLTGALFHFFG